MTTADALELGRDAVGRRAWADAFAHLSAADREVGLEPEDLERLAVVAYLVGRDDDSARLWERAHHRLLDRGEIERAVRCAFWLAFCILGTGDAARGGGWISRARRLLDDGPRDCVEQGYLLFPVGLSAIVEGDNAAACATFARAAEIGGRFGDPDLAVLALHGQGRALIRLGRTAERMALLDEAMVAITGAEVSPMIVGDVYCSVIEACQECFDLRRARSWTAALGDWCASQPDLVPYRGQCLLHRAEVMQMEGAWDDAMDEARQAGRRLAARPGSPSVGAAFYLQAELHRLRGEFAMAERAYREASRAGREPQPGLARMRLTQGRADAAQAAIRRVVDEAQGHLSRSRLLPAYVEIMLATGDVPAARAGADELARLADGLDAPLPRAVAMFAQGAVLLAEGEPRAALGALRRAWTAWRDLGAPYEAARARVLLAMACAQLGDDDSAELELDAARRAFERIGAAPDAARVAARSAGASAAATGGLTPRELEVLRLVSAGMTNRAIAGELVLSEKTVARHLSNIFAKLGVPSRAAATAYAYEHDLIPGGHAQEHP